MCTFLGRILGASLLALLSTVSIACVVSEAPASDDDDDGNSPDPPQQDTTSDTCGALCDKGAAAMCSNQASCVTVCEASRDGAAQHGCGSEVDAYYACLGTNGVTDGCAGNGFAILAGCDAEKQSASACMADEDPPPSGCDACAGAEDCSWHSCDCGDGSVVNARGCLDGCCTSLATECTQACTGYGGWNG